MAESAIYFWNEVALELARRDYEPFVGSSGAPMIMPEQAGPTRTSRALAMIHVAMYEALALSDPASGLTPFGLAVGAAPAGPVGAAATGAAVSTMQALFKNAAQKAYVEDRAAFYTQMLRAGGATQASIDAGKAFGAKVGAAMIKDREGDTPIVGQPDDRNYKVERCHHQADP
ncbi:hypothetical protein [Methylorubrum sp. SB2]|uniref:hypothetical protein n=1 Tax=Methylorubrum subtropicum TaxID=3138812 RepID=UPI00313B7FCB